MTAQMTGEVFERVAPFVVGNQSCAPHEFVARSFRNSRAAFVPVSPSWPMRIAKRTGDLIIGAIICLLSSVVVVVLMAGSALSFKAMPLFTQPRIERHGRRFRILKIRSLPTSAPTNADKGQLKGIRTSGFGEFIRRTHLDELPQLWLVLRGRMSLVGPRPTIPNLLGMFTVDHLASRTALRPGCTGLWQISPAVLGEIYDGSEYDQFYADQMCGRLDLWILWHTALQAVGGSAKTLEDVPLWACANPRRAYLQERWPGSPARTG